MIKIKEHLLQRSRRSKIIIVAGTDFLSLVFSVYVAAIFSEVNPLELDNQQIARFLLLPFLSVWIFYIVGLYRSVLRYVDFFFIYVIFKALFLALCFNYLLSSSYHLFLSKFLEIKTNFLIPSSGWFIGLATALFLMILSRLIAHYFLTSLTSQKRVAIYGAGSAGIQLAEALKVSKEMQPAVFVDKNSSLHNTFLGGIKILSPDRLKRLIKRNMIDEVLIAMPSASKKTLISLLKEIEEYSIKVRILPGLSQLAQGKLSVSELKEVDISDLLGRNEVEALKELIDENISEKVVLITGAGGSIGSELSRQVIKNKPEKLILLDSSEYALYSIKNEISKLNSMQEIEVISILGNVTNKVRLFELCQVFNVQTIYHAAAYKHVSLVEENPFEAVTNNIFGTKLCAEAASEAGVETFVLISTDKAVRPTNIMGATKRFAELILQSMSKKTNTKMTMVRFGNVIGSSGSAIPLFQKQIKEGGPVTVTHPDVIRYFMTIPEAAELVIQAGAMGRGGDVFVLDMGEPVKIFDLAKRLIKLSGMELIEDSNPTGDIEIKFTGLRPGEKLYEELLIGDNVSKTKHKRILKAQEDFLSEKELEKNLYLLDQANISGDIVLLKQILNEVVTGFKSDEKIVDNIYLQKRKKSSIN